MNIALSWKKVLFTVKIVGEGQLEDLDKACSKRSSLKAAVYSCLASVSQCTASYSKLVIKFEFVHNIDCTVALPKLTR